MHFSFLQIISFEELVAACAISFLSIAVIVNLVESSFSKYTSLLITGTLVAGYLHGGLAFFELLGGFYNVGFLSTAYQLSLLLASITLALITYYVVSTFFSISRHPLVLYCAGTLIIIHPIMIGSHFHNVNMFSVLYSVLVFVIITLEARAGKRYLTTKYPSVSPLVFSIIVSIMAGVFLYLLLLAHQFVHGK